MNDSAIPGGPTPEELLEEFSPIRWTDGKLQLLDQTVLPREETWLDCPDPQTVSDAIYRLSVRGAPAIGVAAAYGLVVGWQCTPTQDGLKAAYDLLLSTRPTAVNLRWALELGWSEYERVADRPADEVEAALLAWAQKIHEDDLRSCWWIGEHGRRLFEEGDRVLTHCNAGALATAGIGTAIGVIRASFQAGRLASVWVDETRPLLQGARLTSWELERLGIPFHLVTDNSAGALMSRGMVDRIVVGSDRIAANGDVANKIGTYTVAVLANRHDVPFYVAAPLSTVDFDCASGDLIPIENRASGEVTQVFGTQVAPEQTEAMNIAFDVTPAELVAAIITEVGVVEPPFGPNLAAARKRAESSA